MSQRRRLYSSRALRPVVIALLIASSMTTTMPSYAADPPPTPDQVKDAGRHFQRGVALFNEADYPGALVEFKRANEIAPNPAVLWNIGQTHYQLRGYAAALTTFEKYLNDAGANADHAKEAQLAVDTLRSRVGKIDIVAPDGADVSIDDESVGKAPLVPVTASVGKRKLIATKDGRSSAPKYIEVSAGETVKAEIKLEDPSGSAGTTNPVGSTPSGGPPDKTTEPKSNALPIVLWVTTGALVAGTITTGILAMSADSDLDGERKAFPSSRQRLDDASSKTETLALVTDILGAGAIVVAGIALYVTLSSSSSSSTKTARQTSSSSLRPTFKLGGGAGIGGTF